MEIDSLLIDSAIKNKGLFMVYKGCSFYLDISDRKRLILKVLDPFKMVIFNDVTLNKITDINNYEVVKEELKALILKAMNMI